MTETGCVRPLLGRGAGERRLLGGKAWGIDRMLALGVPVPPAFVVTADVCARAHAAGGRVPDDVLDALPAAMLRLETRTGRTFGRGPSPLLVSVRSGAAVSMPGMMDTVLNLGLTDEVAEALAAESGDAAFAADLRRRFDRQYTDIVGRRPPADPWAQLHDAIAAVFVSWDSPRAVTYRRKFGVDESLGTAVTVQAMVFGNLDDASGTGVLFSRDPLGGGRDPFGEWLRRGQGEDVVSGTHDPLPLAALAEQLPEVHRELLDLAATLEREAADVQDIEFTVQSGHLWLLQTRTAKRSPEAAVRLAVAFADEGLIEASTALDRVTPEQVTAVLRPHIQPHARAAAKVLAEGKPACPGVATGVVETDHDAAQDRALAGEDVILTRETTDPEDVPAMAVARGILTELGGATSHAAVVSRELGVPCVVGCGVKTLMGLQGRVVTIDAAEGVVLDGQLPVVAADVATDPALARLDGWAREETADDATPLPELLRRRRALRDQADAATRCASQEPTSADSLSASS